MPEILSNTYTQGRITRKSKHWNTNQWDKETVCQKKEFIYIIAIMPRRSTEHPQSTVKRPYLPP